MDPREELAALRRLAELEAKASGGTASQARAAEPSQADAASAPVAAPKTTEVDKVLGGAPGRLALGASGVLTGPFQLGANAGSWLNKNVVAPVAEAVGADKVAQYARNPRYDVGRMTNDAYKRLDESKRRGMVAAGQKADSFDAAGLAGNVVAAVAGGGVPKVAQSLGQKVLTGAKIGGIFGAASPVNDGGKDYWSTKAIQAGTGAAVGAAAPIAVTGAARVAKGIRNVADVFVPTDKGLDRLSRSYYEQLIGKGNVDSVADDLANVDPLIAGGKPTAAEALVTNAAGSPIQAQQRITASTPGGVSAQFGQRIQNQDIARRSAEMTRDTVTAPMRYSALARASNIDHRGLVRDVSQIAANPQTQAVKPAREFIAKIVDDIDRAKTADELYAVRKYLGDLIDGRVESENNVAKFAATQLMAMKKSIDTAIENGGAGQSWKNYLSEYAKRSTAIDKSAERAASMYKPAQATNLPGAADIAEKSGLHAPNLLSREAMIANWITRQARRSIEPKLDERMARHFLNPQEMAKLMRGTQSPQNRALAQSLSEYARRSTAAGAGTAGTYKSKETR